MVNIIIVALMVWKYNETWFIEDIDDDFSGLFRKK